MNMPAKTIALFLDNRWTNDKGKVIGWIEKNNESDRVEIPYKIMEEKLASFVKNTPENIRIEGWDRVKKIMAEGNDSVIIQVKGERKPIYPTLNLWLNNFKMWDYSGQIPINKEFNKKWRESIETPYNNNIDILWQFGKIFAPFELGKNDWRNGAIKRLKEVFYEEEFSGDIDEAIELTSMGEVYFRVAEETRWALTPIEECEANKKVSKRTKKFARKLKEILEEEKILHHYIFGNCWIDE